MRQTALRFADSVDSTVPNNFIFNVMNPARPTIIHEKKKKEKEISQRWSDMDETKNGARDPVGKY